MRSWSRKSPGPLRPGPRAGSFRRVLALGCALLGGAFPSPGADTPPRNWKEAFRDLAAREGKTREKGQAWLAEHLEPALLGPFLEKLRKVADPEVRVRAVNVLAGRLDLFPGLAHRFLEGPTPLLVQILSAQVGRGLPPPPEDLESFRPFPPGMVRLSPRPRTPAQVGGLLARNLSFPLPLLVWPGFSRETYTPRLSWGGEVRKLLLAQANSAWLLGGRLALGKNYLLLLPPGIRPPKDCPSLVVSLLQVLARRDSLSREAALALGEVPFLPMGEFFLLEAGNRPFPGSLPFLYGLAAFALRSGFGPKQGDRVWTLLVEVLGKLEGEGLAWAGSALAALGPGEGSKRAGAWEQAWKEEPPRERWKLLLPLAKSPFPSLGPLLQEALARGPATPREGALLLRALALLGLHPPREDVVRALSQAGPASAPFGARLLAPLEKKEGLWALRALSGKAKALAALGAAALGETPGWGGKVLVAALPDTRDPDRLQALLLGLRTARDKGEPGIGQALFQAWRNLSGQGRIPLAIALGLLLDEGFFLGPGPEEGKLPLDAWEVKDQFQDGFPGLVRLLEGEAGREGNPFRFLAARALGRLHGLHQDFQVGRYLDWASSGWEGEKALLLLLREWVQVYPSGGPLLLSALTRGRWMGRVKASFLEEVKASLAGVPPPGSGLDLDVEDPFAWAGKFPRR